MPGGGPGARGLAHLAGRQRRREALLLRLNHDGELRAVQAPLHILRHQPNPAVFVIHTVSKLPDQIFVYNILGKFQQKFHPVNIIC